jgi:hypothetical protein
MRLSLASTIIALSIYTSDAFAPQTMLTSRTSSALSSTVQTRPAPAVIEEPSDDQKRQSGGIAPLTGEEINARRDAQLQKLRMKDRTSIQLERKVGSDLMTCCRPWVEGC